MDKCEVCGAVAKFRVTDGRGFEIRYCHAHVAQALPEVAGVKKLAPLPMESVRHDTRCGRCGRRPTVHLINSAAGAVAATQHLCEACAAKRWRRLPVDSR